MKVLMIGLDPKGSPGGIGKVITTYYEGGLSEKVELKFIASHREGGLSYRILFAFKAFLKTIKVFINWKPDVVHFMLAAKGSFFRKSIFFWVLKALGAKSVFHVHASSFKEFYDGLPNLGKRYVKLTLAKVDLLLVLSESWRKFYSQLRGTSQGVEVLANPVFMPESSVRHGKEKRVQILFLGRLGERKGIYDLVEALKKLSDSHDWYACLAGDGEVKEVESLIKENSLEDRVTVPGWMGQEEVVSVLSKPSILVLPSYREGLPVAILQAMAYGHPVVVTPVGGIPDLVSDGVNGYLVPTNDPQAIANALQILIKNEKLRNSMGKENRKIIEKEYEIGVVISKLIHIYEGMV